MLRDGWAGRTPFEIAFLRFALLILADATVGVALRAAAGTLVYLSVLVSGL